MSNEARHRTLAGNQVDAILVGCVQEKALPDGKLWVPLRELYSSDLWTKRRAYAEHHEQQGCPWLIVSAFHGIRRPDYESGLYNRRMADYGPRKERESHGRMIAHGIRTFFPDVADGRHLVIEIHAGAEYREVIEGPLAQQGVTLVNPLEGKFIGQQKRWYLERRDLSRQLSLLDGVA